MAACNDWHETHGGLREHSRRTFLAGGLGLAISVSGLPGRLSPLRLLETAAARAAEAPDAPILVSLYLDGGNDGLNTLVPLADPQYRLLRPKLSLAGDATLPLHDTAEFAWHPALGGLRDLYDAGKVAVLPAVDYDHPDMSHFNSLAYWRSGIVGTQRDPSGWLGRTLDVLGSADNPLQGISSTWTLDPTLRPRRVPVATISDPAGFRFDVQGVWAPGGLATAYRDAAQGGQGIRGAVQDSYRYAFAMADQLAPLARETTPPPTPLPYPDTQLGKSLRNLGRMLGAGFGTRIASVTSGGGYDTHDDQPEEHARLLADLGTSLAAWQADLTARGLSQRVLTVVWSEFGRRPQENDSLGTDHGAGGLVLVVGDRANGGLRSEFPGLERLDPNGNLRVATDFRALYATLLESWLGVDAGRVLPQPGRARLDLVRAAA